MVFYQGQPGGPGRPKGARDQKVLLLNALDKLKEEKGIDFWPTVLAIALKQANAPRPDTALLRELVKKLLPDQVEQNFIGEFSGFKFAEDTTGNQATGVAEKPPC